MIDNILGYIMALILYLIFYAFLKVCFKKNETRQKSVIFFIVLVVVNASLGNLLSEWLVPKTILCLFTSCLFIYLVFNVSIKRSIVASIAYFGLYASSEMIVYMLILKIDPDNKLSVMTNSSGGFVAELFSMLIVLIIVVILSIFLKQSNLSRMNLKGWVIFALFPFFTLTAITLLTYAAEKYEISELFYGLLFLISGLLILNIMMLLLLDNVIERENNTRKKELLIKQAEHLSDMYRSLSDERERQKARTHDYLNHLNIMLGLARSGNVDEEIKYIEEQIGAVTSAVDIIDTGNPVINAVLNVKFLDAKNSDIFIAIAADNLDNISVSDSDLVIIMTNILDNAIEAVQKCENKKIVFKVKREEDTLRIYSSNCFTSSKMNGEVFLSTKEDSDNHGYGISNIKKTVQENKGTCFIDATDNLFQISVTLPLV